MSKLIMVRHGESCWNQRNIFTGWVDVALSKKGIEEALTAGRRIAKFPIDVIVTSSLIRAQMTAFLIMSEHPTTKTPVVVHPGEGILDTWGKIYNPAIKEECIPVVYSWELNERMYGELQGFNKNEIMEKVGPEQFKKWRRSFNIAPPGGESLSMTAERAIPYFENKIIPLLDQGHNVLISAHGNSLRAICMDLDDLSEDEVVNFEIATGDPIIYNYHQQTFVKEK